MKTGNMLHYGYDTMPDGSKIFIVSAGSLKNWIRGELAEIQKHRKNNDLTDFGEGQENILLQLLELLPKQNVIPKKRKICERYHRGSQYGKNTR